MSQMNDIALRIEKFAGERGQDQIHSPKNLSMALSVEIAELLEHFQLLTEDHSSDLPPGRLSEVEEEIADEFINLVRVDGRQ